MLTCICLCRRNWACIWTSVLHAYVLSGIGCFGDCQCCIRTGEGWCDASCNAGKWRGEISKIKEGRERKWIGRWVIIVLFQVGGRFFILFVSLAPVKDIHGHPIVFVLFLVWSMVELFRCVHISNQYLLSFVQQYYVFGCVSMCACGQKCLRCCFHVGILIMPSRC